MISEVISSQPMNRKSNFGFSNLSVSYLRIGCNTVVVQVGALGFTIIELAPA